MTPERTILSVMLAPRRPDEPEAPPKEGEWWQRLFAIVGIVWAFPFLLTIPGWFALRAYRQWQRRERDTPTFLIGWGIFMSAVFIVALVAVIIEDIQT